MIPTYSARLRRIAEKYAIEVAIYYGDNDRAQHLVASYVDGVLADLAGAR